MSDLFSEDTPWTRSLFENIEHDEDDAAHAEGEYPNGDTEDNPYADHAETSFEQTCPTEQRTEQGERQIYEKDVNEFLEDEDSNSQEQNDFSIDEKMIPAVGMEFKTRDEAQNFFNLYSYAVGFSVVVVLNYRTASRKRDIRATLKCNKYGRNTQQVMQEDTPQRQSTIIDRTCCKVEMVISERHGMWRITKLCLDHNHALSPHSKYFRSHIYMSEEEKAMIRSLRQANITTSKIVSVLTFLRGGHENTPYNRKKVSNYGTSINREPKNSDVMQVVQFFKQKRVEDSNFYYSFQVDKNNKAKSLFWADAKSMSYYDMCGDCISFDTTFLTNKYNLPFAPIVGVSPHGNTYLFACALIVNETGKTFEWVFKEFLYAMGGKHPQTIITDQDGGMQVAISKVFPNSIHRGCLFHVKSKAEDKLCPTFRANEGLYEEFRDIIDNSLTELEFETLWAQMIEQYQVGHIDYFQTLWKNRKDYHYELGIRTWILSWT